MSWILPENHEHDEDGNCIPVEIEDIPPEYPLQWADIIGIGILSVSNATSFFARSATAFHESVTGSCQMLAREFFAHANARRAHQQAQARRTLLIDDLRSLEEGSHDGEES